MKNEINKTAHSTYRCEYHIVFAPKYRRQIVYGQILFAVYTKKKYFLTSIR